LKDSYNLSIFSIFSIHFFKNELQAIFLMTIF
jgi:hypothetical protein